MDERAVLMVNISEGVPQYLDCFNCQEREIVSKSIQVLANQLKRGNFEQIGLYLLPDGYDARAIKSFVAGSDADTGIGVEMIRADKEALELKIGLNGEEIRNEHCGEIMLYPSNVSPQPDFEDPKMEESPKEKPPKEKKSLKDSAADLLKQMSGEA